VYYSNSEGPTPSPNTTWPLRRHHRVVAAIVALTLTAAFVALPATGALAELASAEQMHNVCSNWLAQAVATRGSWAGSTEPSIRESGDIIKDGILLARIYSLDPDGFVVVPVMMELPPVKLYSESGRLDPADEDGFVQMLRDLLSLRYESAVSPFGESDETLIISEHRELWDRLAAPTRDFRPVTALATDSAGPLLTSSWHQGDPYNLNCPIGQNGRTVVGCVATATSQILYYWQWPSSGFGTHEYLWSGDNSCGGTPTLPQPLSADFSDPYDWANMRDSCDDATGCNTDQRNAVAELNNEVGVLLEMDYGSCGSGANTTLGLFRFPYNLKYDWSITGVCRKDYNLDGWFALIQEEINAGRVIQYGITSHSIVCDGWRTDEITYEFHMNYGWGQQHNAWYVLDNLSCSWVSGGICPAEVEHMMIRIEPEKSSYMTYAGSQQAESGGDGDGCPDPGETIALTPIVRNLGWDVVNATATLSSADAYATLTGAACSFKAVLTRGQWDTAGTPLAVEIDPSCPDPHLIELTLHLQEDGGFAADYPLQIRVGSTPGFEDDMESGEGAWYHRAMTERYAEQWHPETHRRHSGTTSWKLGSPGEVGYADGSDAGLITPPILLAPDSELRFWHYMSAEAGFTTSSAWDGGIVMISDNGVDWTKLFPTTGYTHNTMGTGSTLPFSSADGLYSGQSNWSEAVFDLSEWTGMVQLMFRFGSDGAAFEEGWYIDDVWVGNTPDGSDINVQVAPDVHLLISTVTDRGDTWASIESAGPAPLSGYSAIPAGLPRFYGLATTAAASGIIQVTMEYDEGELAGSEADLEMLAYVDGTWQVITMGVNTTLNTVTGMMYSLGTLVLAEPASCCVGRVGDANGEAGDEPTISDISVLIDAKFITGTCDGLLDCLPEADINQSGGLGPTCDDITISDISILIDYLFITGYSLGLPDCL